MAGVYGFSVTKSFTWHGVTEETSNVYHYWYSAALDSYQNLESTLDKIVAAEKAIFANNVTFLRGRVWGPVGDPVTSITQLIKDYTGTGSKASAGAYRELAVVVAYPLRRSPTTGRKRFLRKFLHLDNYGIAPQGTMAGSQPLPQAFRDELLANYANVIDDTSWGFGGTLCAPNGDHPNGAPFVLPYLHTRQLRR